MIGVKHNFMLEILHKRLLLSLCSGQTIEGVSNFLLTQHHMLCYDPEHSGGGGQYLRNCFISCQILAQPQLNNSSTTT